jgi:hypothetical protein
LNGHARANQVLMKINFRRCVWAVALALGIGGAVAAQAAGAPFDDHDYSKTKTYQQGLREGKSDGAHHKDHSKKRHFNKDEDQKAYESGYQKGHGN